MSDEVLYMETIQDPIVHDKHGGTILSPYAEQQNAFMIARNFKDIERLVNQTIARQRHMEHELIALGKYVEHVENMYPGTMAGWMLTQKAREVMDINEKEPEDGSADK